MSKQTAREASQSHGQVEAELLKRIERSQRVINGIKDNDVIRILFEDLGNTKQRIDDSWHLVNEPEKLQELRVTKLAVHELLNIVKTYEHDYKTATAQLSVLRDKTGSIAMDYDTDTNVREN